MSVLLGIPPPPPPPPPPPHSQTDQGIKNLSVDRAAYLAGNDPDYGLKDLFEAIATGNFVSDISCMSIVNLSLLTPPPSSHPGHCTSRWWHLKRQRSTDGTPSTSQRWHTIISLVNIDVWPFTNVANFDRPSLSPSLPPSLFPPSLPPSLLLSLLPSFSPSPSLSLSLLPPPPSSLPPSFPPPPPLTLSPSPPNFSLLPPPLPPPSH